MATRKQINEALEELESIRKKLAEDIFPAVEQAKNKLDAYQNQLFVGTEENPAVKTKIEELQDEIINLKKQADEKVIEIKQLHDEVFQESEDESPIKQQVEKFLSDSSQLFSDTEKKKEDFDTFYVKIFGGKDEDGELKGGLKKELEKYTVQYGSLFDKIESLLPGATSAGLAKVFEDKVQEYKKAEKIWSIGFLVVAIALAVYFGILTFNAPSSGTFTIATLELLHKSPFLLFAVWLLVFLGNRRAENKKLEESYKHKETMARAYVGYKEQIVELEGEGDQGLLKTHMENLLKAVKDESGKFLSSEGDKHPFWDRMFRKSDEKSEEINSGEGNNE